jgi:hypothetical protein
LLTTISVKPKKPRKVNRNSFLKSILRNASIRWPPANEADKLATVERGKRKCNDCGGIFHYKQVQRDHKEPVVPITGQVLQPSGEIDWNVYIDRLLCPVENFSILCLKCHQNKSFLENSLRQFYDNKEKITKNTKKSRNNQLKSKNSLKIS